MTDGSAALNPGVYLVVDRTEHGRLILSVGEMDEQGSGPGYRLSPRCPGETQQALRHRLTSRDIDELRRYLRHAKRLMKV